MCKYCDDEKIDYGTQKDLVSKHVDGGIFGEFDLSATLVSHFNGGVILFVALDGVENDMGTYGSVPISYCPMCGRKLREEEE